MRIIYFKVENFRNLTLVECDDVPDLMVVCGGNGCGKSALLNAIMAAKEHAAPYGGFRMDPRCVSSDAELATVTVRVSFSELERNWYQEKYNETCPESDEIILEIQKGGNARATKRSPVVRNLLSWYSREYQDSPGFFDYIDAHRIVGKRDLTTWDSASLSDQRSKSSLGAAGAEKFSLIKEYLASLVMRDAQEMLAARRNDEDVNPDSLQDIREFFDQFFKPMKFKDVHIDCSPFKYIVETPKGEIDIDDLSSGEKEILNTYIHFHQLQPKRAVILFDEVDAHLHPDLERRYLNVFQEMSRENQILLTTHSPEIMIAAGSDSLFTISKFQESAGSNQLSRVTDSDELHNALSEIMGSNGMVSLNRKVVFIEGEEASADRYIYEALFPPSEYNISFIPAGDSTTNVRTSERVNRLLSASGTFQEFYSIIDGDIERPTDPEPTDRLFRLPVYHVENYLLDPVAIYIAAQKLLLDKMPYDSPGDVENKLKEIATDEQHILPFTRAIFDTEVARKAKDAWDHVFKRETDKLGNIELPEFDDAKASAIRQVQLSIEEGSWKSIVKGRDLLKGFCTELGLNYLQFRNLLISELEGPHPELLSIIFSILGRDQDSA